MYQPTTFQQNRAMHRLAIVYRSSPLLLVLFLDVRRVWFYFETMASQTELTRSKIEAKFHTFSLSVKIKGEMGEMFQSTQYFCAIGGLSEVWETKSAVSL